MLLHGSGANATMWLGDVPAWAGPFRVHAVDVIGEPGLSAPARPPLGSPAYARWLDDVLDHLGLDRVALVGASLGGWLDSRETARRMTGAVPHANVTVLPGAAHSIVGQTGPVLDFLRG